jgi:hypothetical protein
MATLYQHCFNVKITSCSCLRSGCHCSLIHAIRHMWCLSGTCSRRAVFSCCSGSPTPHQQLFYWKLILSTGQLNLYLIMCKIYQMSCDLTKSLTFPSFRKNTRVSPGLLCNRVNNAIGIDSIYIYVCFYIKCAHVVQMI